MELFCIDLEASGLSQHSYPIEIAWKGTGGESDSFMIDPSTVDGWQFWDDFAEELHGICRSELAQSGIAADEACRRLNRMLAGKYLLSDALEYDSFWIGRLFQATGIEMAFELRGLESVLNPEQLIQYKIVCKTQLRRHRAMSDVEHILHAICSVKSDT